MRRAARAVVVSAVFSLTVPSAAFAHAQLEGTSPERGATVAREPATVEFRFDEPVEGTFGAVRVFDAKGDRVDAGDASHPGGSGPRMAVHLRPRLPHGTYTATYRVVSADGHIVSGGFVFSLGHPGAAPSRSVGQLIGGTHTSKLTSVAFAAARALQFAALAAALGGVAFLVLAWFPGLAAVAGATTEWQPRRRRFAAARASCSSPPRAWVS